MKKATWSDKNVVVDILTKTFRMNPHADVLVNEEKNKNKVRLMMEYLFEDTYNRGEIYLSEDGNAVALWRTSKPVKFNPGYLFRKLTLWLRMGVDSAYKMLKMDRLISMYHPKKEKFAHLYTIGVLPEGKGKGYSRKFIDYMSKKMDETKSVLFLDTVGPTNIGTYNKFGFHVFRTFNMNGKQIFCMNKPC